MSEEIHNLLKIENDKTTIFTNKELKMIDDYINELESYKYNMDRDYLRLEKENKILRENAEHNDKIVDKVNWENLKLKEVIDKSIKYISSNDVEVLKYHDMPSETSSYEIVTVDLLEILKGENNE